MSHTVIDFALHFRHISKSFGSRSVLRNLSLNVEEGQSMVIMGPSGSGKTVLLKCALALIEPDAGNIFFRNQCIQKLSSRQKEKLFQNIGVVFQSSSLFDSLTVWENISFHLHPSIKHARDLSIDLLQRVGLPPETADLYPDELSGGMRRRISLARAMAHRPRILFFDEPTTGLDPIAAGIISTLIRDFISSLQATAITITHDVLSASIIGDEVALLDAGAIAWQGSSADLMKTKDLRVRQFVQGNAIGPLTYAI